MEEQTGGYTSDLTEEQWDVLEPLIGVKTGAGRPLKHDLRQIVNAILYVVRTGIQWRALPPVIAGRAGVNTSELLRLLVDEVQDVRPGCWLIVWNDRRAEVQG